MSSGTPSLEALQGRLQEERQWRGLPLRYKVVNERFMSTKVDVQEWEWEDVAIVIADAALVLPPV
jgi:hypothetical protein